MYSLTASPAEQELAAPRSSRRALWLLLCALAIFTGAEIATDFVKPFWFDEISTLIVASTHSLRQYVRMVPGDAQPPLGPLLVHFCLLLPGPAEVTSRLPSLAGVLLAAVCIFLFLKERGAALAGLCAALYFLSPHDVDFAAEARPYGLLMGFTALLAILYQAYCRRPATTRLAGIAFVFAALVLTHPMGLLYAIFTIAIPEVFRWKQTGQRDWRLAAVCFVGCLPFAVVFWIAHETKLLLTSHLSQGSMSPANPTIAALISSVIQPFRHPWQAAVFVTVLLAWRWTRSTMPASTRTTDGPRDWLIPLGITVAALVTWIAARLYSHYYFDRYATPLLVAAAMALGLLLHSLALPRKQTLLTLLVCAMLAMSARRLVRTSLDAMRGPGLTRAAPDPQIFRQTDIVAVDSPVQYVQLCWYATPEQRKHLIYVSNEQEAVATKDAIPELSLRFYNSRGALPFPLVDEQTVLQLKRPVTVLSYRESNAWLPEALVSAGYQKQYLGQYGKASLDRYLPPRP